MNTQIEMNTINSQQNENPQNIDDMNTTEINPSENNPQKMHENHLCAARGVESPAVGNASADDPAVSSVA